MTTVAPVKPASEKQTNLIKKLVAEKQCPADFVADMSSSRKASDTIDLLFSFPRKPQAKTVGLTEGIYEAPNGDIIKIQKARNSENVYAKVAVAITGDRLTMSGEVVKFSYVYTPGLVKHITPAMRMDEARAEAFAIKFGKCAWCGRSLKAAQSVKQGIGPVCIKRFQ